jgi:hypothetical protein
MDTFSREEGYTAGFTVFLNESKISSVLDPDGEPIRYTHRSKIGFDLSTRKINDSSRHTQDMS